MDPGHVNDEHDVTTRGQAGNTGAPVAAQEVGRRQFFILTLSQAVGVVLKLSENPNTLEMNSP